MDEVNWNEVGPELLEALNRLFGADMEDCMLMDGKDEQLIAISYAKHVIFKASGRVVG